MTAHEPDGPQDVGDDLLYRDESFTPDPVSDEPDEPDEVEIDDEDEDGADIGEETTVEDGEDV